MGIVKTAEAKLYSEIHAGRSLEEQTALRTSVNSVATVALMPRGTMEMNLAVFNNSKISYQI